MENFFKESTLVALRELAMRQAAYSVESRLPDEQPERTRDIATDQTSRERLLLVLSPAPSSAGLIRRGRRVADYLRAECLAVYVSATTDLRELSDAERQALERHLNFARALQIETRILQGRDLAESIVTFARLYGVTQIFVSREKPSPLQSWFAAAFAQRLVSLARDMQVTIVADRSIRRGARQDEEGS
jgi:two-component system sensor histidine kinase KdpD